MSVPKDIRLERTTVSDVEFIFQVQVGGLLKRRNRMDNDYDTITTEFAELYEEYCAESDRLFFEWQDQVRYEKQEHERMINQYGISGKGIR